MRLHHRHIAAAANLNVAMRKKILIDLFASHVAGKDTVHKYKTKYGKNNARHAIYNMNIVRRKPAAYFAGK